jgi:HK97 family phage prohead protease
MSNVVVYKQFETKATSIDEANYTITFKISDSKVDRQGEIVSQKDWQMKNYMANPVLLFGHDPSKPEYVIGQCVKMVYDESQDCHFGTYKLDAGFNPTALLVWNQLVAGTLRTVSLGFIAHDYEMQDDIPVLSGVEPLETSVVPIPANAGALAKSHKAGKLDDKDARFMVKTMREEADRLENQIELKPTNKEKSMTDEQANALIEGMSKLTEKVDALATENQTLRDELAADKKAQEEAAAQAEADKKAADEEAERKAKEEAEKADPAKGGEDDQPGAGDAEIDDDTELTPELQAQIDAELAAEE